MKKALITGGAKRLGAKIAVFLAERGYEIILHHNNSDPSEALKSIKTKVTLVRADLNKVSSFDFDGVDLLINSASSFNKIDFATTNEAEFDLNFNLHVKVPFFLSQKFASQAPDGAQIINIIDAKITKNQSEHFSYLLSKKALWSLTQMLAATLGPKVRVNAISPSTIAEFNTHDIEYIAVRTDATPLRALPETADVLAALGYLLDNKHITGQNMFVDSGESLI